MIDKANLQNNIENDSIDVDISLNEIIVSKQLILPQIQLTKSRQGRYIGSKIEKPKNKVPSGRDIKNIPSRWDYKVLIMSILYFEMSCFLQSIHFSIPSPG